MKRPRIPKVQKIKIPDYGKQVLVSINNLNKLDFAEKVERFIENKS